MIVWIRCCTCGGGAGKGYENQALKYVAQQIFISTKASSSPSIAQWKFYAARHISQPCFHIPKSARKQIYSPMIFQN